MRDTWKGRQEKGKAVAARAKAKTDRVRKSEGGRGAASERSRTAQKQRYALNIFKDESYHCLVKPVEENTPSAPISGAAGARGGCRHQGIEFRMQYIVGVWAYFQVWW